MVDGVADVSCRSHSMRLDDHQGHCKQALSKHEPLPKSFSTLKHKRAILKDEIHDAASY